MTTLSSQPSLMRQALVLALLGGVLFLALAWFNASVIVPARGLRFDFYPHYVGGQAFWRGESPYTDAVTQAIQTGMYGGAVTGDQHRVVYFPYSALFLAPLLALPAPTAVAVWLTVQMIAILLVPILWFRLLDWRLHPAWVFLWLVGACFVFRYPINSFLVGQFTHSMLLLMSLAILCLHHRRDVLAGILLASATIPPTIALPFGGLLLLGVALCGRWRGLAAFSLTLAGLLLFTVLKVGWWLPELLDNMRAYNEYAFLVWAPGVFGFLPLTLGVMAGAVGLLGFTFLRLRRAGTPEHLLDWALSTLLVALVLLPQSGNYYLVLLIPHLIVIAYRAGRLPAPQRYVVRALVAAILLSPWLFYALRETAPTAESLLLPLTTGLLWAYILWRARENAT